MRKIYDMPSSNVKVWMEGNSTFIAIKDQDEQLSAYEVEDLIDTLVMLRPKRHDALEKEGVAQ